MKKTIRICLPLFMLCMFCMAANAQNNKGKTDDIGRIALSPYVISNANIPSYAISVVENKLSQIVAKQGLGSNAIDQRFVITANLVEVSKEITATAPPMVALKLTPTIYIGDIITGDLYASCELPEIKGVGNNETKAYLSAVKAIRTNNPAIVQCIEEGKTKIIEFYNSQIDFIMAEAESMVESQQYDEAMIKLAAVPEICKDAYIKATKKIGEVFQKKIDLEGDKLYNEANSTWNTAKNKESAEKVVELLAQINPLSAAAEKGRALVKKVESHYAELAARRREIEERNWAFKMQQYNDEQENIVANRENEHEYRMQKAEFDYEVHMEKARNGADASEYALQEVKSVISTMSNNNKKEEKKSDNFIVMKIKSWFH